MVAGTVGTKKWHPASLWLLTGPGREQRHWKRRGKPLCNFDHNSHCQEGSLLLGLSFRNNPDWRWEWGWSYYYEDGAGRDIKWQLWIEIRYLVIMRWDYLLWVKNIYCSEACAINLGSSVIITGGAYHTITRKRIVSEYKETGWIRDLPSLLQGRYSHGCSYYDNNEGTKVDILILINHCPIIMTNTISDLPRDWWLLWGCLPLLHWAAGGDWVSLGLVWRASISSLESPWGQHWQQGPDDR